MPNYAKVAALLVFLVFLSSAPEPFATFGLVTLIALGLGVLIEFQTHKSLSWE